MPYKIIEVDIGTIIPYENNPRKNDDSVVTVASSIKEFGFKQPILVDVNRTVITGHTRLKAALKLDLKKVPIRIIVQARQSGVEVIIPPILHALAPVPEACEVMDPVA